MINFDQLAYSIFVLAEPLLLHMPADKQIRYFFVDLNFFDRLVLSSEDLKSLN